MAMVLLAMEGKALSWFHWWEDQTTFPPWGHFEEVVIKRFQPGLAKDPYGPILRIRQKGSVMEYIEEFEMISGPLRDIDREILKVMFLNGLKDELQADLKIF